MADNLIQQGNNAAASVSDNNIAQTQADNATYVAANPNVFGTQNSTTPTVMSPTQAFNNNQIPIPTIPESDHAAGVMANAATTSKTLDDYIANLTPPTTELDKQNQGLLDSISTLTGQEANKSQDLLNTQNATGVPDLQKQLADLNGQIKTATAAYEAKYNRADIGVGQLSADVTGQQGAIRRAEAADVGLLTARAQAVQGNLSLALDTASKAIDAKYSAIEGQIAARKAQLDAIAPQLNKQQQTQALAQQQLLKDQEQKLADQKATQKDAVQYALTNDVKTPFFTRAGTIYRTSDGKAYSSKEQFFADGGAKDFSNAPEVTPKKDPIKLSAGETLYDPVTKQPIFTAPQDQLEREYKQAQIDKIRADMAGGTADYTTPTDPNTQAAFLQGRTEQQAQAFAAVPDDMKGALMQLVNGDALLTDVIKSRGLKSQAQVQNFINAAMAVDPDFSINTNKQRYTFKQAWNNPQGKAYITRDAINTGLGHLAELKQISDSLSSTSYKKYNTLQQWIDKESNGKDASAIAQFKLTVNLLAPEIAKVYAGGVPDEKSIGEARNSLLATSPKNINTDLINLTANLMTSKLNSNAEEYKNVMGVYPGSQIVHTDVLDQLQAAGVNTQGLTKALIQQGMKASSVKDYLSAFPSKQSSVDKLVHDNPNLDEQDVLQILQPDFNQVGNTSASTGSPTSFVTPTAKQSSYLGGAKAAPVTLAVAQKYPAGSIGPGKGAYQGQCAVFVESVVRLPTPDNTMGDSKSQKFATVDKYGIPASKWTPQVGDVIVTGENSRNGHTAVVNAILPDGRIQLSESNFKSSKTISHDRIISAKSPVIHGALRGQLKVNPNQSKLI